MSEVALGLGLATAASAVGAVAACIKGISQQYEGGMKTAFWVLGFTVGMAEGVFDSWALAVVSSNVNLSCKGFGVLFSAVIGVVFAGEKLQKAQYVASFFLVVGPLLIAYAAVPHSFDGIWCPLDGDADVAITIADVAMKAVYAIALGLLVAGHVFNLGKTGGVADFRVLGWILCASIFHTLQANRIHDFHWDPFKDMVKIDPSNWSAFAPAARDRLQVSAGVLTATVLFQTAETMAFKHAGSVGPVHAAYIGTLILDAMMHDMGHGQFAAYTCTQYWILALGAVFCFIGASFAASIKHEHRPISPRSTKKSKKDKAKKTN